MADTHDAHAAPVDPNSAPMHHEVRDRFALGPTVFCYLLAAVALIAGVITGLTVIND